MSRSLENRSLDRGLAVLGSLSMHGASSLQDLHSRTSLPKSTIKRILGTLMRRKIVRRSLSDQLYRPNIALPVQDSHTEGWLVDRALPHMIELTRHIEWSCDLHVFERSRSRVLESTRPLSPFLQYERRIGLEVPVFGSAAGMAVLSTWDDGAVLALVDEVGEHSEWGPSRLGMTRRDLLATLRRVRTDGYATRDLWYRSKTPPANKLHAIACPILRDGAAVGALVVLWRKEMLAPEDFARMHLKRLKTAAARITADLTRAN
jgi:IclR family mhp operon transcriptional activator